MRVDTLSIPFWSAEEIEAAIRPALAQIEMRRQFAVPGVEFLVADIGQMRPGDLQDIGAVLGQCAGAGRTGQHARQIEHADPGKRAILAHGHVLRMEGGALRSLAQPSR